MSFLSDSRESFPDTISADLLKMVLGEKIGTGSTRNVYEWLPDPTMVVKYEGAGDAFANVLEFKIWEDLQYVKHAKSWLAPCFKLSANGVWMLQARTETPSSSFKWPNRIPRWLTDCKKQNFGLLKGKLVCHDYALNTIVSRGATKATKKPDFWNQEE